MKTSRTKIYSLRCKIGVIVTNGRVRVIVVLTVHFVMSVHHDWIQARLRVYERQRLARAQRAPEPPAAPPQPAEAPPAAAQAEEDDVLFQIEKDDVKEKTD